MGRVTAVLQDGREVELDPRHGKTVAEVVERLTDNSLTGSAAPLADARLSTVGGGEIVYSDVNTFTDHQSLGS